MVATGRKMRIRAVTIQDGDILYSTLNPGISLGKVTAKYTDFEKREITVWVHIQNSALRARQIFGVQEWIVVKRECRK